MKGHLENNSELHSGRILYFVALQTQRVQVEKIRFAKKYNPAFLQQQK